MIKMWEVWMGCQLCDCLVRRGETLVGVGDWWYAFRPAKNTSNPFSSLILFILLRDQNRRPWT